MEFHTKMQPVSVQANVSLANVKPHSGGCSQNSIHVNKYLLLGKVA